MQSSIHPPIPPRPSPFSCLSTTEAELVFDFEDDVSFELLKKWKSGSSTPSELFDDIHHAVECADMDPLVGSHLVAHTLAQAGMTE